MVDHRRNYLTQYFPARGARKGHLPDADNFIAVHLSALPCGGVYSKLSTASRANPKRTQLAALEQTSFQGTTLRGPLLEAYAFSEIGVVMLTVRRALGWRLT